MSHRTPNFIVVALAIIMLLLGFFYMSCSSTTAELRHSLVNFEDRIRSLTMKANDYEKQIDVLNSSKYELEERQGNLLKQLEQKDSDINDLNTKINKKNAELLAFKSDKQVLEERIKDLESASKILDLKNSEMETFQRNFQEQKNLSAQQVNELRKQIENYKQQINQLQLILSKPFLNSNLNLSQLSPTNKTQFINQNLSTTNNSGVQRRIERSINDPSNNQAQIKANLPLGLNLNILNLTINQTDLVKNEQKLAELDSRDDDDAQLDNVESNKNN